MTSQQRSELLAECVEQAAGGGVAFEPTGIGREAYLDVAERLVRLGATWQRDDGQLIDPWQGLEVTWASARFVGALGGLIGAGRCLDLLPHLEAGMRYIARRYVQQARGETERIALEFFSKEFGWALIQAREHLSEETWAAAAEAVAATDPDALYVDTLAYHKPEQIFNFNTFSLAGEQLLRRAGLRPDEDDYIERHIEHHLPRFTDLGLYCDPDAAMVYDWVPRVNLSTLLWAGYEGPLAEEIGQLLARGAETQLLLHSPSGLGWFGGRSNQYQFNEMQLAVICEYEAARRAQAEPVLAGMFRRAARLGLRAVRPWLEMNPPRHIKNRFHPAAAWGFDVYGGYSVYLLLAASLMTFAYHFAGPAEETVAEAPLPAEVRPYAVDLGEKFHRIFCHCRGLSAQIDTAADQHYDATGLGRVIWLGASWQLQLPAPMPREPKYYLPRWLKPGGEALSWSGQACRAAAIAVAWQDEQGGPWQRLAEAAGAWDVSWESGDEQTLSVTVTWRLGERELVGRFEFGPGRMNVAWKVPGAARVRAEWPVPLTDGGADQPAVALGENGAVVRAQGWSLIIEGDGEARMLDGVVANRNGLWRLVAFDKDGDAVGCSARVEGRSG